MKLIDTLLLSSAVAFLIIGIYEIFIGRFAESYWVLMLMLLAFFGYAYRRRRQSETTAAPTPKGHNKTSISPKKRKSTQKRRR